MAPLPSKGGSVSPASSFPKVRQTPSPYYYEGVSNRYLPNLVKQKPSNGTYPATVSVDGDTVICLWPNQAKECWIAFAENKKFQSAIDSLAYQKMLCEEESIRQQAEKDRKQAELEATKLELRKTKARHTFTKIGLFAVAVFSLILLFK